MLGIHDYWLFVITGILLNLTPGQDTMFIIGKSITGGLRAGFAAVCGISTGSVVHTLAAALGLSAILASSAVAFTVVKLMGAAYLLYLGTKLLLSKASATGAPAAATEGVANSRSAFVQGILTNVLNPKVALFFLALLPQFIDPASPNKTVAFLCLGATFIATGMVWSLVLATGAARLQSFFLRNPNVRTLIDRMVGGLFLAMGARLAWSPVLRALPLLGMTLITAALVTACALPQPNNSSVPAGTPVVVPLRVDGSRYRLEHSFADFYDTAFVLTNGTRTSPRVVSLADAAQLLGAYDVVLYGESHGHSGVHLQEMQLLRALYEREPRWIVSFEQFERDVQGVVDGYLAGKIGETTLTTQGRAWNNYAASYRPLLVFAKAHRLPVVAAEAPDWAVSCIGRWGPAILDQFTPLERSYVARDIHVPADGPYRDKFMGVFGATPGHSPQADAGAAGAAGAAPEHAARIEHSFAAQAARDDTMAEAILDAVRRHPGYKVLHVTGSFHVEGFLGTAERLRQLDSTLKVAVINPVQVSDPEQPDFTADEAQSGTLLQLIYPNPETFVEGEDTSAMMAKMTHAHDMNRCRYSPPGTPTAPSAPHGLVE